MTARPDRGFAVGAMRHRVNIEQPVESQDDSGQPVVTWSTVLNQEPASYMPTGGTEQMNGRQLEAGTRAIFYIHYRCNLTRKMRLKFDNDYYGITALNEVKGQRRYLEIVCSSTPEVD